uniref:Uncharacterized protein n=1 Tax=Setaria italica TaxID=4555 RepID=K3Y0Q4_SETIT
MSSLHEHDMVTCLSDLEVFCLHNIIFFKGCFLLLLPFQSEIMCGLIRCSLQYYILDIGIYYVI